MGQYLQLADELLRKAAQSSSDTVRARYLSQAADYEQLAYRKGETRNEPTTTAGQAEIQRGEAKYSQARSDLTTGYGKAKTALTDKMAGALKSLTDRYMEIDKLIKEEEKGAAYDPARRVTLAATPIRQGIDNLARTLMDFQQRTGSYSGAGTKKVVEDALGQLVPLASQETRAAFDAKRELGREQRSFKGEFARGEKDINVETATGLSNLERNLATDLSSLARSEGSIRLQSGLRERGDVMQAARDRLYSPLKTSVSGRSVGGGGSGSLYDDLLKLKTFQESLSSRRAIAGGSGGYSVPVPIQPGSARHQLYNESMNQMSSLLKTIKQRTAAGRM